MMTFRFAGTVARLVCAAAIPTALAASPLSAPPPQGVGPLTKIYEPVVALQEQHGGLWGVGPGFRVQFLDTGIEMRPEQTPPLRFTLESIDRGGAPIAAGAAARTHEGLTVEYRRVGCVERYEIRPDGVAQSFVFESLPQGDGDLVVRGWLQTELRLDAAAATDQRLHFDHERGGGVTIEGVFGIDAAGRRVPGRIRCDGAQLEVSLPAAFVRDATLPLVLDPVIGPVQTVAYDSCIYHRARDSYFSCFRSNNGVYCQEVGLAGVAVGPRIAIELDSLGGQSQLMGAVYVPGRARLLIGINRYSGGPAMTHQRVFRAYDPATGLVSAPLFEGYFPSLSVSFYGIRLSADTAPSGTGAVYSDTLVTQFGHLIKRLELPTDPNQAPTVASFALLPSPGDGSVILSAATPSGMRMAAYETGIVASVTIGRIDYQLIDANLAVVVPLELESLDSELRGVFATEDWQGYSRWTILREHHTAGWRLGRRYKVKSRSLAVPSSGPPFFKNHDEWPLPDSPAPSGYPGISAAAMGDSLLVANWGGGLGIGARLVNVQPCYECEPRTALGLPNYVSIAPRVVPGASEQALLVSNGSARIWESRDGVIGNLGGGCLSFGVGHILTAHCARVGNGAFQFLHQSPSYAGQAWLAISTSRLDMSMGCGCSMIADPFAGFLQPMLGTSRFASNSYDLPIPASPALSGLLFFAQALQPYSTTGCSGLGQILISNALSVRIQG